MTDKRKIRGKLNAGGVLEIERAGRFKMQECKKSMVPMDGGGMDCHWCGDDCSLFKEPHIHGEDGQQVFLYLCTGSWIFDEFEDER